MASTEDSGGMPSPPDTPKQEEREETGLEEHKSIQEPDGRQDRDDGEEDTECKPREAGAGDHEGPLKEGSSKPAVPPREGSSPPVSPSSGPAQEATSPASLQPLGTRGNAAQLPRPAPQSGNSETSLVRYTRQTSTHPASGGGEDDDDEAEEIPRDPRSFARPQRSPHLPPPMSPFRGFMHHPQQGVLYEYEEPTETETDVSSTHTQSRRRDLGRDLNHRRERRERREPPRYDEYADDEDEDYGYGSRPGSRQGYRASPPRYRGRQGDSDYYSPQLQGSRSVPRGTGPWMAAYRQGGLSPQDEYDDYSYDERSMNGILMGPDPPSKKNLRRERSMRRQERSSARLGRELTPRSETKVGGSNVRLQMSLNLDVDITIKAKIKGGIEFSML
ncbi:hypothetical protein GQ53DRAFT_824203 [Thozetella sp. PMI_491]|nr:hypothetical protein GQ53DRAFT_824203 [Thozetella sp. PMI_491]